MRSRICHGLLYLALLTAALPRGTGAAVFDITPADVTPRSFSVIWISDGTLIDATVKVFADAAGTTELTGGLGVSLASGSASLGLGIVKVDVSGAAADTCVYVQTETTEVGGPVQSPVAPPFLQVCTPVSIERARVPGGSIANDVLLHAISLPDSAPSADEDRPSRIGCLRRRRRLRSGFESVTFLHQGRRPCQKRPRALNS